MMIVKHLQLANLVLIQLLRGVVHVHLVFINRPQGNLLACPAPLALIQTATGLLCVKFVRRVIFQHSDPLGVPNVLLAHTHLLLAARRVQIAVQVHTVVQAYNTAFLARREQLLLPKPVVALRVWLVSLLQRTARLAQHAQQILMPTRVHRCAPLVRTARPPIRDLPVAQSPAVPRLPTMQLLPRRSKM